MGQYRHLAYRVHKLAQTRPLKTIAVTSATDGEGKTLTAINLALTLAENPHTRTALVEIDFRRPTLAKRLGMQCQVGIVDFVLGLRVSQLYRSAATPAPGEDGDYNEGVSLEHIVAQVPGRRLVVLPAGGAYKEPAELLNAPRFEGLATMLRQHFEYVVFDTSSLLHSADVNVIDRMLDGILLVIRAKQTPRQLVLRALSRVDKGKVIGTVLNSVDPDDLET